MNRCKVWTDATKTPVPGSRNGGFAERGGLQLVSCDSIGLASVSLDTTGSQAARTDGGTACNSSQVDLKRGLWFKVFESVGDATYIKDHKHVALAEKHSDIKVCYAITAMSTVWNM